MTLFKLAIIKNRNMRNLHNYNIVYEKKRSI